MNFHHTLSLLVLFISFSILGGCVTPGRFSPHSYALRIVNNTNTVLILEEGRDVLSSRFEPGETRYVHTWGFRNNHEISFVVTGFVGNKYIGVATYTGHACLDKMLDEVWVIQELIPPVQFVVAEKEEKK